MIHYQSILKKFIRLAQHWCSKYFNNFRGSWTVIRFQFTQQKFVPEIKQSGTKGRLLLTVLRIMDIFVFRTKRSPSCWSSVTQLVLYGYRKVISIIYQILILSVFDKMYSFKKPFHIVQCKIWYLLKHNRLQKILIHFRREKK